MLTLLQVFFLPPSPCFSALNHVQESAYEGKGCTSHLAVPSPRRGWGGPWGLRSRGQQEEIGQDVFRGMPRALHCQVRRGQGRSQRPSMCCLAEGRVQAKQGVKCLLIRSVKTGLERQAWLGRAWKCDKWGLVERELKSWVSRPHCR